MTKIYICKYRIFNGKNLVWKLENVNDDKDILFFRDRRNKSFKFTIGSVMIITTTDNKTFSIENKKVNGVFAKTTLNSNWILEDNNAEIEYKKFLFSKKLHKEFLTKEKLENYTLKELKEKFKNNGYHSIILLSSYIKNYLLQ